MPEKKGLFVKDKFKQVKITFKERIKEVLDDIINGMEFLKPDKSWPESLFIALCDRFEEEDHIVLDREPWYENMLREIDAIYLETMVTSVLIHEIQKTLDSETRRKLQDRKLKLRKPKENLHRFLVSN
jgi:hypothetical protein